MTARELGERGGRRGQKAESRKQRAESRKQIWLFRAHLGAWFLSRNGESRRARRTAENAEMKGTRFELPKRGSLGELHTGRAL
jgi:hypothetical protein